MTTPPDELNSLFDLKPAAAVKTVAVCWGCQKEESAEDHFQYCPRCKKEGFVPCRFCSQECFKQSWPKHIEWHRTEAKEVKDTFKPNDDVFEAALGQIDVTSFSEYDKLIVAAVKKFNSADFIGAKKILKKAIKVDTRRPEAFHGLAKAFIASTQKSEALHNYEQACSRWAFVAVTGYNGDKKVEEPSHPRNATEKWVGYDEGQTLTVGLLEGPHPKSRENVTRQALPGHHSI